MVFHDGVWHSAVPTFGGTAATRIHVHILDGESGGPFHKWKAVTPVMKAELDETGTSTRK